MPDSSASDLPLAVGWGFWLWWVLASTVGWVVGMPVGGFVGWAALGAVYGAITGVVLVWLLRQRPLGSDQPSAVPN
jgi:hypothetical protein